MVDPIREIQGLFNAGLKQRTKKETETRKILGLPLTQSNYDTNWFPVITDVQLTALEKGGLLPQVVQDILKNNLIGERVRVTGQSVYKEIDITNKTRRLIKTDETLSGLLKGIKFGKLQDSFNLDLYDIDYEQWPFPGKPANYELQVSGGLGSYENVRVEKVN